MEKISRPKIYEQVVKQLKEHIAQNHLQPGDRLPTEVELVKALGVSRLSIREALKSMEAMGIVTTGPRAGTRLRDPGLKPFGEHLQFLLRMRRISIQEMADVRKLLECAIIPTVVANADKENFDRLLDIIERMRTTTHQGKSIHLLDMEFHQELAAAAKNRAFGELGALISEFFHLLYRDCDIFHEELQMDSIEGHESILEAIRARDTARAVSAMEKHLDCYDCYDAAVKAMHEGDVETLSTRQFALIP